MLSLNIPPCYHISLSHVVSFDIKIIHQRIQTTHSRASRRHHCNDDFVLFHNATCYTNPLLSRIHVTTVDLLNITCTLVATCMISAGSPTCVPYIHYELPIITQCGNQNASHVKDVYDANTNARQ